MGVELIERFIFGRFLPYVPRAPPYEPLGLPIRAPRMWGMGRDPIASLGRRGAHGDGLMGMFGAMFVVAAESLRSSINGISGRQNHF